VARPTNIPVAAATLHHALVLQDGLTAAIAASFRGLPRLQIVALHALADGVAFAAQGPVTELAVRGEAPLADPAGALVAGAAAALRQGGQGIVSLRALRQGCGHGPVHVAHLLGGMQLGVTGGTQEPVALAAVGHDLPLLGRRSAPVARAADLTRPRLQGVTLRTVHEGLAGIAEVPVAR